MIGHEIKDHRVVISGNPQRVRGLSRHIIGKEQGILLHKAQMGEILINLLVNSDFPVVIIGRPFKGNGVRCLRSAHNK